MKTGLISLVFLYLVLIVSYAYAAVDCPSYADSVEEFENINRNVLLDFLNDPGKARLNKQELNDLFMFYVDYKDSWDSANCLEAGDSGETIRSILEKYSGRYEESKCVITGLSWDASTAYVDDNIGLNVEYTGECDGSRIMFNVLEDDFFDADDEVRVNPRLVSFDETSAKGVWKAEWQDDGLVGGPEYYFRILYNGLPSREKSGLLNVRWCSDDGSTCNWEGLSGCEPYGKNNCGAIVTRCSRNVYNDRWVSTGAACGCNGVTEEYYDSECRETDETRCSQECTATQCCDGGCKDSCSIWGNNKRLCGEGQIVECSKKLAESMSRGYIGPICGYTCARRCVSKSLIGGCKEYGYTWK